MSPLAGVGADDPHRGDEPAGRGWFHPGFAYSSNFREFLPILRPTIVRARPTRPPGGAGVPGGVAVRALPDEIAAGNIRAVLNLGGSLLTSFPDVSVLEPALQELDVLVSTDIIANATTELSTHVLPTKDQLERADVTLWDFLVPACPCSTPRRWSSRSGTVGRPGGSWPRSAAGWATTWALPGRQRRGDAGQGHGHARCTYDDVAATGFAEVPFGLPAAWVEEHLERAGGWRLAPDLLVDQLAALTPPPPLVLIPRRQAKKLNASSTSSARRPRSCSTPTTPPKPGSSTVDRSSSTTTGGRIDRRGKGRRVDSAWRGLGSPWPPRANVNLLTDKDDIDTMTGMVRYSGVPVTVTSA